MKSFLITLIIFSFFYGYSQDIDFSYSYVEKSTSKNRTHFFHLLLIDTILTLKQIDAYKNSEGLDLCVRNDIKKVLLNKSDLFEIKTQILKSCKFYNDFKVENIKKNEIFKTINEDEFKDNFRENIIIVGDDVYYYESYLDESKMNEQELKKYHKYMFFSKDTFHLIFNLFSKKYKEYCD